MSPRYTCPFVEKFSIEIETYYRPDAGQQTNVFNLSAAEKRQRILGAYGCREAGSRRRAGPDACRGSHAALPELGAWVCCSARGAQLPCWLQGLSVCNTLGFALPAGPRVLGTAIEGPQQGKAPVPRAPCPELPACFLGSAARVRIKDVLGVNFVLCLLPLPVYLFAALLFPVPAFSPLLPCPSPCPTQSGTALPSQPLSGCAWEPAPGSCRVFRISWSGGKLEKRVPIFPPPALIPLLPRALLQIALRAWAPPLLARGTGGQSWEPGVGFLPRRWVWPWLLWPPFPGGVDLVVLGTGVQSVTRCLLKWRPKIGTWRK